MNDLATSADTEADDPFANDRASKPWLQAIKDGETYFADWQDKCDKIDKLYADLKVMGAGGTERQMQVFWANLEVLKPSIYARPPVPVVSARFKDRKPLLRHASEILERALSASFEHEDIDQTMIMVRDDLAISGRGAPWLRYKVYDDQETVCYDHLDRRDFLHEPARKWKEVGWVARRSFLTIEQMRERFEEPSGKEYASAIYGDGEQTADYKGEKKAKVWEIWSKTRGVVAWVSEGCEQVLDIQEPFLTLEGFFPCPRPVYGTVERGTLKPVPDFVYYRDQIEEINELTARISALSEALRLKGFYAGGNEDVTAAIETAIRQQDNNAILIPVPNFAALGGAALRDAIVWLPVEEVANIIVSLVALRKEVISDVYQITGISDIMRGSTDANETLGAQQLKSQYGSVRIRDRQSELIRIARDMTRMAAEIMAENFTPESLMNAAQYQGEIPSAQDIQRQIMQIDQQIMAAQSNPQMVQQAQANPEQANQILEQVNAQKQKLQSEVTIEAVVQLLRDQKTRPFALDIETDSTIVPDENAQKQRTTEFLGALSQALSQLSPMIAAQPQSAEFAGEVLKFAVGPFRAGRSLEGAIDGFVDQMKQMASQPKPNPEAEKMQAEAQAKQAEVQLRQQIGQIDLQIKERESEIRVAEGQMKLQLEQEKMQLEQMKMSLERQRLAMDGERLALDFTRMRAQAEANTAGGENGAK